MEHDTTAPAPPVELTADQRTGLIAAIAAAYPPYCVWWSAGIWYATGPCPRGACGCSHTLHAPNAGSLCEQLAAIKASRVAAS